MLKQVKDVYLNLNIQAKMMFNFLFVIALTVFVLSYLNISVLNRSLSDLSNQQTLQMAEQVQIRIENYIKNTNKTIDFIENSSEIRQLIVQIDNENQDYSLIKAVEKKLDAYANLDRNIAGILIVDKQGKLISTTMEKIEDHPLTMEDWYIQSVAQPDTIHMFSQPIGRNVRSFYDYYKPDNIISFTKALVKDREEVVGVVLLDMKLDEIESIINSAELGKSGFLYIADRKGEVVYAPVNDLVYRINPAMIAHENIVTISDKSYQIISMASSITNWQVVGVFPQNETLQIIVEMISYFIVYGVIIFLLAIILSSYLTRSFTKPIEKLRKLMAKAEQGELSVKFNSKYNDEISKLGKSFNKMIDSIHNLVQLVYSEQKAKREAELKAFQAQIKPHFLYNTLDTINWMAMEYGAEDISEVITSLTTLFRISLSKGNEIITLENEIKHVESYLNIQKVRYEDKFNFEIQYNKEDLQLKVIKLIIQPLVENAIYHGIKKNTSVGFILIKIYREGEALFMEVSDNGLGIEEEQLNLLNAILNGFMEKKDEYGIGVFNVNERIKLNFGSGYGLSIDSKVGFGTTVTIKHPIL